MRRITAGADHPRSRGVYQCIPCGSGDGRGSSPLARGLLRLVIGLTRNRGIIPARAGFTALRADIALRPTGSSPLARGLPSACPGRSRGCRIIPARAGFTQVSLSRALDLGDHPRSRGVYCRPGRWRRWRRGSSPLARGLPPYPIPPRTHARIIPARAGFTALIAEAFCWLKDHPRSRGVYGTSAASSAHVRGSSPLARGLLPDGHGPHPCPLGSSPLARGLHLR